jgi:hypothetical protein
MVSVIILRSEGTNASGIGLSFSGKPIPQKSVHYFSAQEAQCYSNNYRVGGMKTMNLIRHIKVSHKDKVVDQKVMEMAHDDAIWEKETVVLSKSVPTSIRLSPRTISRAKFFARIHHERGYQSWLKKVVEERIDTEYELYKRVRKAVG